MVQVEVMLLEVSPIAIAATHLIAYQATLVKAVLLREEEALLFDLDWTHSSIFGDFDWLADSDKRSKFRIKVHEEDFFVFKGESCLASRH